MPLIDRTNLRVAAGQDIVLAGDENADALKNALTNNPTSRVLVVRSTPEALDPLVNKCRDVEQFVRFKAIEACLGRWNKDGVDAPFDLKVPHNFHTNGKLDFSLATTLPTFDDKCATTKFGRSPTGAAIPTFDGDKMTDDGMLQHLLRRPAIYRPLDAIVPDDWNVSFVSLKTNGTEGDALQGMAKTARRCRPVIAFYSDDDAYGEASLRTRGEAIAYAGAVLSPLDYTFWFYGEGGGLVPLDAFDPQIHCAAKPAAGYQPRPGDHYVEWFVAAPRAR